MSNNKQSMKLYTEEQVNELRRALRDIAQWDDYLEEDWEDAGHRAIDALRCFEKVPPIELPSDEEIHNEIICDTFIKSDADFFNGAKYVINKIQGGNNEQ